MINNLNNCWNNKQIDLFHRMIIHSIFLLMVSITLVIAEESDNVLFDKRAPTGHQEMQGKEKNSASLNSENFGIFKRALMGFQVE